MALQATDEERRAVATWVVDNAGDLRRRSSGRSTRSGPSSRTARAQRGTASRRRPTNPDVVLSHPVGTHHSVPGIRARHRSRAGAGDQPEAIAALVDGHRARRQVPDAARHHRLREELHDRQRDRARPSGRRSCWRPTRRLAAQLAAEFRELFPKNRVEYFVSYYDYYQPEAYLPTTDTYIEKDSSINDEIDRLRHSATSALLTRRDVIIVASVSAIYGLGSPEMYAKQLLMLERRGGARPARDPAPARRAAVRAQRLRVRPQQVPGARRHDRGLPRVRGAGGAHPALRRRGRAHLRRSIRSPARSSRSSQSLALFPASHYATDEERLKRGDRGHRGRAGRAARRARRRRQAARSAAPAHAHHLRPRDAARGRVAARASRTTRCTSTAASRHQPPYTLLDYFPDDWLCVLDESHVAIPQLHGQFEGDRSRKETLVEHGFRLPSAMDNRPLRFEEFMRAA